MPKNALSLTMSMLLLLMICAWASSVFADAADEGAAQAAAVDVDLSTPRATLLETYFPAINRINRREGDLDHAWQQVLATMQWQDVVSEEQARQAAMQLLDVLDKLGRIESGDLPGEADLRDAAIGRYLFFPKPAAHDWVWKELAEFGRWPEGEIVFIRTEAGWQFAAETIRGIEVLAKSMAPLRKRHLAPQVDRPDLGEQWITSLGPTFAFTPYWAWGALLLGIFLGLAAGKAVSSILRAAGDRLHKRGRAFQALILHDAASPASLSLFALGLGLGFNVIHLADELTNLRLQVLQFLYLFALGWFLFNIVNIVELSLRRFTERIDNRLDDIIVTLIRRALRIFLVVMFTLVVAENVFGLNVTAWIAGFGIVGLAISLAAQDSLRNLFGSITVFLDKPFKVGDFIEFDGHLGTVETIGFRSTRLRLLTGHVLAVPNSRFIESNVENISARPSIRRLMNVTITYDTPSEKLEQAVQIVKDILRDEQVVAEGRFDMAKSPPQVAMDALNSDSLNIVCFYWYQLGNDPNRGWFTYLDHCQLVNIKLIHAFREAGIDFAFPTQTLYLAGDKDRELSVRLLQSGSSQDQNPPPPQPLPD